jgi:integrase/recombinase XerD
VKRALSRTLSLYTPQGGRKYLNRAERLRALKAMKTLAIDKQLFAMTLAWTGARVSEVLALTPASFQLKPPIVAFRTLKQRTFSFREVPVPPKLIAALNRAFGLRKAQRDRKLAASRLWPWSRVSAWRYIKTVMRLAKIAGRQACPRGLRHAFGVGALQSGVPLNIIQKWLGHSDISSTAIYAAVCGPEEVAFAERFWTFARQRP